MQTWQTEMIWLSIVYRLAECGETIPINTKLTRFEFIESILDEMHRKDLLAISDDKQVWILAAKGRELLTRLVAMFDTAIRFEIFADVDIGLELDETIADDEGDVFDEVFDPRFAESKDSEDLRIALMTWFAEYLKEKGEKADLDPKRIIFLQMLANGKFAEDAEDFWFSLREGSVFREIEEIADLAYQWTDLGETDEESFDIAHAIYTAGMLEQRKREGNKCSACQAPLATFEALAAEENFELSECPCCNASFEDSEESSEYECPRCKKDIYAGQSTCYGCGAHVDFSLPSGSVETETIMEEEHDSYGYYYDYCPYGWYDPWDPYVSGVAFGVICGAILF